MQNCTSLLQHTERQLHSKSKQVQEVEAELHNRLASLAVAEQQLQQQLHGMQPQQQLSVFLDADCQQQRGADQADMSASQVTNAKAAQTAVTGQEELELLKEKLHDSVELLEELDRQLREKVEEAEDNRASLHATQQALEHSQQLMQDTKQLLSERTAALQEAQQLLERRSQCGHDAEELLNTSRDAMQDTQQQLEVHFMTHAKFACCMHVSSRTWVLYLPTNMAICNARQTAAV